MSPADTGEEESGEGIANVDLVVLLVDDFGGDIRTRKSGSWNFSEKMVLNGELPTISASARRKTQEDV